MNRSDDRTEEAEALLERVVKEAVDGGADLIEFERVPDGLEISCFVGHTGIGSRLDDRELEAALFRLVAERTRSRRTFQVDIRGRQVIVRCEWYQSFMEDCFRLRFVERKAASSSRRKGPRPRG